MNRYTQMFNALGQEGAFVPFAVLGDPDTAASLDILRTLIDAGADALELGIPFSDPVADGPTIQAANIRALAAGMRPRRAWELISTIRGEYPHLPIGLLVYANLVEGPGRDIFYQQAQAAGVDSVLVADVPSLEAAPYAASALAASVLPVLIATSSATPTQLDTIARLTQGYTYVVTRAGVTGTDQEAKLDHAPLIAELAARGAPPALLGFGISRPEHVRAALACGAHGAIAGSAIAGLIAANSDTAPKRTAALAAFVASMKAATRG